MSLPHKADSRGRTSVMKLKLLALLALLPGAVVAKELHVSTKGSDSGPGSLARPLRTISEAARRAQPGDTVTVHAGTYREWVNPARGGTSENRRITYRAAPGEKVVVTGAERAKGWQKVSGDTWKLLLPNAYFKGFNPFATRIKGDWFDPQGKVHHAGSVYFRGDWLSEARTKQEVMEPAAAKPKWFASADGDEGGSSEYLLNISWLKANVGAVVQADTHTKSHGTQTADSSEGGRCVGWISVGHWLMYEGFDFGPGSNSVEFRVAAPSGAGGRIELRLGSPSGHLIGVCKVLPTGDWQKWQTFKANIEPTHGRQNLCLLFKGAPPSPPEVQDCTVIYAQFPKVDPNKAEVEISVRPTVFTPNKTGVNYITVRGFDLRCAATNWAPPTAGQIGLMTAYWNKGWIIEDCEISYSRCSGVSLGKYSDKWDGSRGTTEGYYLTIEDALKKDGWSKKNIGSHIVRRCRIHHCGQTGIVGSLGCAFSQILGNEIHDINLGTGWGGAEMAGIKFHGAIDVVIKGNHIYRCGEVAGIWLDWMAQGTQVAANLLHDNGGAGDLFCEVDHGPYLVANNIMLSARSHLSNSRGGAYLHNLFLGTIQIVPDGRRTPFMKAHSTQTVGMSDCPVGDSRWINNIFAGQSGLADLDSATLPVLCQGNIHCGRSVGSRHDSGSTSYGETDPGFRLVEDSGGWWLEANLDRGTVDLAFRQIVVPTDLGLTAVSKLPFEDPKGQPLHLICDYFDRKRRQGYSCVGPFAALHSGRLRELVWPKKQ